MNHQRMIGLLLLTAWLVPALICPGPAQAQVENLTQVIDVQIYGGINDAVEDRSGEVFYLYPGGLPIGKNSAATGLRFMEVNIPKAAAITKPYIEFTGLGHCNNIPCSKAFTAEIRIEDSNDAHAFMQTPGNISGREFVDPPVPWEISGLWVESAKYKSPDIKQLIQRVVDRPGWNPENDLGFSITGPADAVRWFYPFEAHSTNAAKLHVEFVSHVVENEITANSDDMFQYKSSATAATSTVNDGATVYLVDTTGYINNIAVLRFSSVPVPPGASIVRAWLRFRPNGPASGAANKYIRIQGEKVPNPGTFNTSASSPDSPFNRKANSPLTDPVEWNSIETWVAGHYYDSADIRTVIQQLVSPSNSWAAGNAMAFFLYGNDHRRVYSSHAGNSPVLHIEYETSPVGGGGGCPS